MIRAGPEAIDPQDYYEIPNEITVTKDEFDDKIWPNIDSIWAYPERAKVRKDGCQRTTYWCRQSKKCDDKPSRQDRLIKFGTAAGPSQATADAKPKTTRNKETRERIDCKIKLAVIHEFRTGKITLKTEGQHRFHTLNDCYSVKTCSALRSFACEELGRNYPAPAIAKVIEDETDFPGREFITSQKLNNIKQSLVGKKTNPYVPEPTEQRDFAKALQFLAGNSDIYLFKVVENESGTAIGVFWILKTLIDQFQEFGYLVQMDSTHETNRFSWRLVNVVFRNGHGVWLPGFHILVKNENSVTLTAGLRVAKESLRRWKPY